MATLTEIQTTETEMLEWFINLCEQNHLKCTAVGGTMLGAVRHHGFIPWDDDVDLYMPMEDALKLLKVFCSEQYFLQAPETDIQMPYLMYKIRKNNTIMEDTIQKGLDIHKGVWIDVFLYTNAAKGEFTKKTQVLLLKILQSFRCRYYHTINDPKRKVYKILSRLPRKWSLSMDRFLLRAIKLLGSKKSKEVLGLENMDDLFFEKRYFEEREQYSFSDFLVWGPKDYNGYLSRIYGNDYMTPKKWGHIQDYSSVKC